MENEREFTHFNDQGRARMVNVGDKPLTHRTAAAAARVLVNEETFALIQSGGVKKGDVLTVAQIAGIMGSKRTPDLIPLCHPVTISGADLELTLNETDHAVGGDGGFDRRICGRADGLRHVQSRPAGHGHHRGAAAEKDGRRPRRF